MAADDAYVPGDWPCSGPRSAAPVRCSPLCGAVRAYGKRALDPSWWWKHENQCPMREHLRKEQRAKLDS